jgi:hypothetical protein
MLMFVLVFSCTKIDTQKIPSTLTDEELAFATLPPSSCDAVPKVCLDCGVQEANGQDSVELATVLGTVYTNPYSLNVMRQAFNTIYGYNLTTLAPTHKYIKITCNDINLIDQLESDDVEIFDHPLNRNITQEGDYWPEAYTGLASPNDIPILYAVIENNYVLPAGINYQVLELLYIPDDNDAVEDEAFYATGNLECGSDYANILRQARIDYFTTHRPVNPCEVTGECGGGGGGGGGGGPINFGNRRPSGKINFKTYVTPALPQLRQIEADEPLRYVRVVGRRFFKIDKTFTDVNGNFTFSKKFPKKVTLIVKFRTSSFYGKHSIRQKPSFMGFWRARFAIKKNIGTYRGSDLSNLNYKFEKGDKWFRLKTRKWLAAVSLNSIMNYDEFLANNGMLKLPTSVRLYLEKVPYWENNQIAAETPEFDFIRRSTAPCAYQNRNFWQQAGPATLLLTVGIAATIASGGALVEINLLTVPAAIYSLKGLSDIYLHFATTDLSTMTSTKVALSVGQQLGIVYLNKITDINGNTDNFSKYIDHTTNRSYLQTFDNYRPFGTRQGNGASNNSSHPEIVAIWQMFAQHMAHSAVDYSFGSSAESFKLQNVEWQSDFSASSSKKYLEGFAPNPTVPTSDYFSWIPVGLINDLIDTNNESFPVSDQVSGFTNLDILNVLVQEPSTMQEFKNRVIALKPNLSMQINLLFSSYGY